NLSPRHRRYADIITRSGQGLLTIINDILDLSKIESGKLDLEARPVSPDELVADIASLFWERGREKGLQIATIVRADVPEKLILDPTRLNQVLTNLVNNALKFTETGGVKIDVKTAQKAASKKAVLVIDVTDTGIGIPADKIEHIFDAFSQADQTTTRRFGGTGLGLTVCRRLVDAMGGEIEASSHPGGGSRFRVTLPLLPAAPAPAMEPWKLTAALHLPDGQIRSSIGEALLDFGCKIVDGPADFRLATSKGLKELDGTDGPIVLLSDIGDALCDTALRKGDAADLLPAPFTRRELMELLDRVKSGTLRGVGALQGQSTEERLGLFEGVRVLAAEDNAVNREVLREALTTLGVVCDFAETGIEAVEMAEHADYDLILMDGSMPQMDGFEATRVIRENECAAGVEPVPVFALTADVVGTGEADWAAAGATGYLTKPFTLERLAETLSSLGEDVGPQMQSIEPGPDDKLMDDETVQQLEALGAPGTGGVRDKVWALFLAHAPEGIANLSALVARGEEGEPVAREAHKLKSMALSAGAAKLAGGLDRLETLAHGGADTPALLEQTRQLSMYFSETSAYMRAASNTLSAA
ncbi:MAG: ATP-binding protein, partial [Pseudomonadota bacterium]